GYAVPAPLLHRRFAVAESEENICLGAARLSPGARARSLDGYSMKIRRVVTGHDAQGRAIVAIDEVCANVVSRRPNHASCVVWSTVTFPPDNSDPIDYATLEMATTDPCVTGFRLDDYQP